MHAFEKKELGKQYVYHRHESNLDGRELHPHTSGY